MDSTPPELLYFSLNLTAETLALTFSETVNASSLLVDQFTLYSDATVSSLTANFTLTTSSFIQGRDPAGQDSTEIVVELGRDDLNQIKELTTLAVSNNTTYLSVTSFGVLDMAGNFLSPILPPFPKRVQTYFPDILRPELDHFDLDMNLGLLTLYFNETVNASSLDPTGITLLGTPSLNSSFGLTLNGAWNTTNSDGTVLQVYLLTNDLNEIKRQRGLAHNVSNTFITLTNVTLLDMFANPLVPVEPDGAIQVSSFVNDSTRPTLLRFELNLTSEILALTFDETVAVRTIQPTEVTLLNGNRTSVVHLTGGLALGEDSTVVLLNLTLGDLNRLKVLTDVATDANNTFLAINGTLIQDMNFNWNYPIDVTRPLMAAIFFPDRTRPQLEDFTLDVDGPGLLTLSFSESVDVSTLNVTQITLVGLPDFPDSDMYTFTPTTSSRSNSTDGPVIEVQISAFDLNELKKLTQLATSRLNTYISITSELVDDMNANPVVPVSSRTAILTANFTRDTTPPELVRFELDVDRGEIILTFTETVFGPSLDPSSITIRNSYNDSTQYLILFSRSLQLPNDVVLTLQLSDEELNELKRMRNLGTNSSNSFLSILNTTIHDMNENYIVPIPGLHSLGTAEFREDETPPTLEAFDIDLDRGTLTLSFSETVNGNTLNISVVNLQNGPNTNITSEEYPLTDSTWTMIDSTVIVVNLSFYDLNAIKKLRDLSSDEDGNNTFISLPLGTIADMNHNPLVPVDADFALKVQNITLDMTPPQLVTFDLDLNDEQLLLTFTETVDRFTLDIQEFTLVADPFTLDPAYNLTGGYTPSDDNYIIVVQLDIVDVNNIKRDLQLAVDNTTTYVSHTPLAISDMNGNMLDFSSPLQVSVFTEDSRMPVLVAFDLDMDSDLLVLEFNETVAVDTLMISEITLQDAANVTLDDNTTVRSRTLQSSFHLNVMDDPTVVIHLHPDDINYIKKYDNLASTVNTSYISVTINTILDMNNNPITEVSPMEAQLVRTFVRDTTSPVLVYYELDLTLNELRLIFNETVNVSSLDASDVTFVSPSVNQSVTLTGGIVHPADNSTNVTLRLTRVDLNEVKKMEGLAVSSDSTFLQYSPAFVEDMAGNAVSLELAREANAFIEDLVSPALEFYHLDMNEGLLHLTFDETVRSSTLQPLGITLLDAPEPNGTVQYTLKGGYTVSPNGPVVTVELDVEDLNNVKRFTDLATSVSDTYIAIEAFTIDDMNNNSVAAINVTEAQQASNFTDDDTSPRLVSFDLDFDSDVLWLTFDETVNATSIRATEITFTSGDTLSIVSTNYTLTEGSVLLMGYGDDMVLPLNLSRFDSNELKKLTDLATSENNTFLLLTALAVLDMRSNMLAPVASPHPVLLYTPDTTQPTLEGFVVDMDNRWLQLYFSETVNSSSLLVGEVTLQDFSTALGPTVTLTPPSHTTSSNAPVIIIQISVFDVYDLTAFTNLYTSVNDSYLTFSDMFVMDMNGNAVVNVTNGEGQMAVDYIMDVTAPELLNFTVDLDAGTVQLFFDEAIAFALTDLTKFHTVSDASGSVNYTLTNGTFDAAYTHNVTLFLDREDINGIKVTELLWTNRNDTWLYLEEGAVYDWTMMNPINETRIPASSAPKEEDPPILVDFYVNMTSGELVLIFNEPVRPDTITPTRFILENMAHNSTTRFPLRGGYSVSPNGLQVTFQFSYNDLNDIKARVDLFTSINDSYLTLLDGAIRDMVYNPSAPTVRLQAAMFFGDRVMPHLISYDLDMNVGMLFLTFFETVDVSTFNLPAFQLQRAFNISESNPMSFHRFSAGSVAMSTITMLDNRHVTVTISLDDLNEIKRKRIATATETTWLVMDGNGLVDNNNQTVVPLVNGLNAEQVTNYTADTTSPELESFYLDLNDGTFTLSFSETVDAETLTVSQFTLLNRATNSTQAYTLVSSSLIQEEPLMQASGDGVYFLSDFMDPATIPSFVLNFFENVTADNQTDVISNMTAFTQNQPLAQFNSFLLIVYLSRDDLNEIKKLTSLATNNADSYLSITSTAVLDMVGNNVTAIASVAAKMTSGYTMDTTEPVLLSYDLDIDAGNLTITFSETVNVSTLDVTQLTFHNTRNIWSSDYVNYTLRSFPPYPNTSTSVTPNDPVVIVQIGHEDLDSLKNIRNLATAQNNTFLSWTLSTIDDMAGNDVIGREPQFGRHVALFSPDTTPPKLVSFDLDLNDGRLILTFSETVKIRDSLNVTEITLLSFPDDLDNPLFEYSLTSSESPLLGSSSIDDDSRVVFIMLSFVDLNAVKYRSLLATDNRTTFLSITNLTVVDLADNEVVEVPPLMAQPVRIFTEDSTPPVLVNFTLDMDASQLILTFNETVNSSSLQVEYLTLQNSELANTLDYHSSPYSLTSGEGETNTTSDNDHILVIHLGPIDRNEIKRRRNLAVGINSTFLSLMPKAIRDMNDNLVTPINDGSALMAANFIPDGTPPTLTDFSIDMDEGQLVLTFDETIRADTLNISELTLLDNTPVANSSFSFSASSSHDPNDNTTILIDISVDDLNEIKRRVLCREVGDCFISHTAASVYDMVGNPIALLNASTALQVTTHVPDTTRPEVVSFAVNLTDETLSLTFTETVNASSLTHTAFTLQDFFQATFSYKLTGGSLPMEDSTVITFTFSLADLNEIKRITTIYTDRTDSWLTFTRQAIDDLALLPNPVVEVNDTNTLVQALVADSFYPDLVRPRLLSFDLDLNSSQLVLYFSETVRAGTFMVDQLLLQNKDNVLNVTEMYNLTPNSSISDAQFDFHIFTINLGIGDSNAIKVLTGLATDENSTFLSFTDQLVVDMNGNAIVPIDQEQALPVREYTADRVRPKLTTFYLLDIDEGTMVLLFSEAVNATSLDVSQIRLQASSFNSSSFFYLTPGDPGSYTDSQDGHAITIRLSPDDLNAIKEDTALARNASTSFISVTTLTITDMNDNPVIPVVWTSAVRVVHYISDSTPPQLVSFCLNLTSDLLSLTFDETVMVDSLTVREIVMQAVSDLSVCGADVCYQLTSGTVIGDDDPVVDIMLVDADLNEIKRRTALATSTDNTFISFSPLLINDMEGTPVVAVLGTSAAGTVCFYPDTIRPTLVSYHLDMDTGVLALTFDETMNVSSLNASAITLQDNVAGLAAVFHRPNESFSLSSVDDPVVFIQLTLEDVTAIKSINNFALSRSDTYLVFEEDILFDMSGNPVEAELEGVTGEFTADTTRPSLVEYHIDLIREEVTFIFNEPINASVVDLTAVTLQDGLTASDSRILRGGTVTASLFSTVLVVTFADADVRFLKRHSSLATSLNDTFILFTSEAFQDTARPPNPVQPLVDTFNASMVRTFVYYPPPLFTSIRPTAGRAAGGTSVTVQGGNFGPLSGEPLARRVDVLFDFVQSRNVTVTVTNVTLTALTPAGVDMTSDTFVTLTLVVDDSALMLNVTRAYRYLPPPTIASIYPTTASEEGGTLVAITGEYFGPSTASRNGPPVQVFLGNGSCSNVSVLNDTLLTCYSPPLLPGDHALQVGNEYN